MTDNKLYTENSIESLDPLSFTRLKPQIYVGDCSYSTQLLVEIISNSIDEFRLGHGTKIEVIINDDIITVKDNGQGFIVNSYRDDGKTILEAAFSVLNTSGKYREDGTYEGTSLGSYGIGSKLVVFLTNWAEVTTFRDGKSEYIKFIEGVFSERKVNENSPNPNGTIVKWKPSNEFFTDTKVEISKVKNLFKVITCLCSGLTIELNDNGKYTTYYSDKGLNELADEAVKDNELIDNRFEMKFAEGKNKMDMILTYTSNYSCTLIPYVNTGLTEKGLHITQVKTIITREFNKFFRDKKWLKEKEDNLTGDDIQEGMYIVFNITAPGVAYDAQVKSTVSKIDMSPFTNALVENLRYWMESNEKEIKLIADKALSARKAREAAKKARDAARVSSKKKENGLKGKMELSDKFYDCTNKNPKERNLLLVEGLSAGGAALEARNVKTDCIYMLRGKTVSPLKHTIDKITSNQEMHDIIEVIGAGFGNDKFDVNKMQFDKIVITSDQDVDGMDIELLLITFFYTYMRPLVEAGKLYRAVTPLYIITTKKEKFYLYTEDELADWKALHKESYELTHCKGLGEIKAEVLKEICFDNQRFKRITISDIEESTKILEVLQGEAVAPRKQFIYDNATQLGFNFM